MDKKILIITLTLLIAILAINSVSANELNETSLAMNNLQSSNDDLFLDNVNSEIKNNDDILELNNLNEDENSSDVISSPIEKEEPSVIGTTIYANDINMYYKDGTRFVASFYDYYGSPIVGYDIYIELNGVQYTRTTDYTGSISMAINLNPGYYTATVTDTYNWDIRSYSIHVNSIVAENKDLVKYYKGPSAFFVKLLDNNGNAVSSGVPITYNINGVFYTRHSDLSGYVKLNINLRPGNYIITGEYKGYKFSNNVKVLTTLTADDLSMTYKDGSKFEVKLLDGQGNIFAYQEVKFNINGVFYTRTTDSNGIARLNINLPSGDYIITSEHNGLGISNEIHISSNSNTNDDEILYIDLPSYDTTTTVQKGKYKIEVIEWRIPPRCALDIILYDLNDHLISKFDYYTYYYYEGSWHEMKVNEMGGNYHKASFAPDARITKVAVKLKDASWY